MDARENTLTDAFIDSPLALAGIKARQFSIGSLNLCRKMGLHSFLPDDEREGISPPTPQEKIRHTSAFAWAHCAPLQEVLDRVSNGTWGQAVDQFEFALAIDDVPHILAEIQKVSKQAGAAAVDIHPRDGAQGGQKPPGN